MVGMCIEPNPYIHQRVQNGDQEANVLFGMHGAKETSQLMVKYIQIWRCHMKAWLGLFLKSCPGLATRSLENWASVMLEMGTTPLHGTSAVLIATDPQDPFAHKCTCLAL